MNNDMKNLKLLSLFHYILGGISALVSFLPGTYIVMGIGIIYGTLDKGVQQAPAALGIVFIIIGSLFMLAGWAVSICVIVAGLKIRKCKSRTFCLVIAAIMSLLPFGAPLSIFTIVILMKDSVKKLFEEAGSITPISSANQ